MPIQAWVVDYSNRQVDLELLQSIQAPVTSQRVTISTVTQAPKIVTGVEKAIQRYIVIFLSLIGDNKYALGQGTDFVRSLAQGVVQSGSALRVAFALANSDALKQLADADNQTEIYGSIPTDEQIDSVRLLEYNIDYALATVYLSIQVTMTAGDTVDFIFPVTVPR